MIKTIIYNQWMNYGSQWKRMQKAWFETWKASEV